VQPETEVKPWTQADSDNYWANNPFEFTLEVELNAALTRIKALAGSGSGDAPADFSELLMDLVAKYLYERRHWEQVTVKELKFSTRITKVLEIHGITTIRQFMSLNEYEMRLWSNIGAKSYREIEEMQQRLMSITARRDHDEEKN